MIQSLSNRQTHKQKAVQRKKNKGVVVQDNRHQTAVQLKQATGIHNLQVIQLVKTHTNEKGVTTWVTEPFNGRYYLTQYEAEIEQRLINAKSGEKEVKADVKDEQPVQDNEKDVHKDEVPILDIGKTDLEDEISVQDNDKEDLDLDEEQQLYQSSGSGGMHINLGSGNNESHNKIHSFGYGTFKKDSSNDSLDNEIVFPHVMINNNERGNGENNPLLPHEPKKNLWQKFKSLFSGGLDSPAANFASINSPGTQTGVVGTVSGINSLLNPPPQITPNNYTQAVSGPSTGIGVGANLLSGGADLLSTAQGIKNMKKEGGIMGFFRGIRDTITGKKGSPNETGQQAETRSTSKRLLVDGTLSLADAGSQGMQAATGISALMNGGTSALSPVLGTASAGIGMGVQSVVAIRSLYRALQAHRHKKQLENVNMMGASIPMINAKNFMDNQLSNRRTRSIIGGIGATAGAIGGGLLLGGLLGASMLTPVGWALAGAGALTAGALGLYRLIKYIIKKRSGQLGSERGRHTENLHDAINDDQHQDHEYAKLILAAHNITKTQAQGVKGKQLINRKLQSW